MRTKSHLRGRRVAVVILAALFLTLITLYPTSSVSAESASFTPPPIAWQKTFSMGDFGGYVGNCMIQTSDGGYALAGSAPALSLGNIGPWLIKVNYEGDQQWIQPYFGQLKYNNFSSLISGQVSLLVQTSDGGYALGGSFNNGACLIKADSGGNILWNQTFSTIKEASALIVTSDGGFAIAGYTGSDCWLGKLNSTGQLQWSQTYASENVTESVSLLQTSDGGYAILVNANPYYGDTSALLIKTNSLGAVVWSQTYDWPLGGFQDRSFIQTNDGGYVLAAGVSNGLRVVKTNSDGNVIWNQTYSQFGIGNIVYSVIQTSDGGYAFGCGFPNPDSSGSLVKIDSAGNLQWNITVNGMVCSVVQTSDGQFTFSVSSNYPDNNILMSTDDSPSPSASTSSVTSPIGSPVEWSYEYSVDDASSIRSMIQTSDGGYALAGLAMQLATGSIGFWLVKVDSTGNQTWSKPLYADEMNVNMGGAQAIVQTPDGGYGLVGGLSNYTYLIKTDSEGNIQWEQSYSGLEVSSLIKTADGGYVMAGSMGSDCWLGKADSSGDLVWNQTYGDVNGSFAMSVVQASDGGYALAAMVSTYGSEFNALLIKTDSFGNMLWNRTYNGPSGDFEPYSIIQTSDGGYVLAGGAGTFDSSGNNANFSVFFVKTDLQGNVLWNQTFSNFGSESAQSIIQTSDGGYALACSGPLANLVKTDSDGTLQWSIVGPSTAYSVVQTSDGGYAFAGSSWLEKVSDAIAQTTPNPTQTPTATPIKSSSPSASPFGQQGNSKLNNASAYYIISAAALAVMAVTIVTIIKYRRIKQVKQKAN